MLNGLENTNYKRQTCSKKHLGLFDQGYNIFRMYIFLQTLIYKAIHSSCHRGLTGFHWDYMVWEMKALRILLCIIACIIKWFVHTFIWALNSTDIYRVPTMCQGSWGLERHQWQRQNCFCPLPVEWVNKPTAPTVVQGSGRDAKEGCLEEVIPATGGDPWDL